ncbi:MAG TPA: hypothetical protein VFU15_17480, partial [Bacteroidia bacterium]|nr:hypothetical protein [Bacteroidia bacterium]
MNVNGGIPVHTNISGGQDQVDLCVTNVHDGIIFVWRDSRSGSNGQDIYAQKLTPCGDVAPGWPASGLLVCNAAGNQQVPQIVPDTSGGAVITWQDTRGADWDIYAQHVSSAGVCTWTANGVAVCTATGNQQNPHLCIDGTGGAVICWDDMRSGNWDVYAAKVTGSGTTPWTANGVPLVSLSGTQNNNCIATDSAGGAFFAWEDSRPASNGIDLYAIRLNTNGNVPGGWPANGLALSTQTSNQKEPCACNTGGQTAMIAWADGFGAGQSILASRLNGSGGYVAGWSYPGNLVGNAITQSGNPGTAELPKIAPDCGGGAYISFGSHYSSSDHDVLTQHMGFNGIPSGGLETTAFNTDIEHYQEICADGNGGAVNVWQDQWPPAIVWYRKFGSGGVIASQFVSSTYPDVAAMRGVWYAAWENNGGAAVIGSSDIYAISSSASAPPPILNSTLTQTYTGTSCDITTQNVSLCAGSPITFSVPLPRGLYNTYTFLDGATVLQTGTSASYTTSALTVGTHTITATSSISGSCVTAASNQIVVTVTAGPAVTLSSQTDVLCNGGSTGSATMNATGGSPAYTYAWTPAGGNAATASSLAAGTYTCLVTDQLGCAQTQTVTITEPAAITATVSSTAATCGNTNGSATVNPAGGNGSYSYVWSPSGGNASTASSLAAGSYTCAVTDGNGCSQNFPVSVNSTGGPTVTPASQADVSCFGGANGTASVTVTGGTPGYSYAWTPSGGNAANASGLGAGTYTCTVTDGLGCVQSQTFSITQPTALSATSSVTNVACNGGLTGSATVNPSGGAGGYS